MTVAKIKSSSGWIEMVGVPVPAGAYTTTIGNGSSTTFTITHSLNVTDVVVVVRESGGTQKFVYPEIRVGDANTISLIFSTAPSTNQYRVLVTGGQFVTAVGSGAAGGVLGGTYPNPDFAADVLAQLLPKPGDLKWVPYDVTPANEASLTPGWLVGDGRTTLLRSDFPNLWPLLVPVYGSADGTHFTLPPLAGRTVIAKGSGTGLTVRAVGDKSGTERVKLDPTEMPYHLHGIGTLDVLPISAGTPSGTIQKNGLHAHGYSMTLPYSRTDGVSGATNSGQHYGTAGNQVWDSPMTPDGFHDHPFTGDPLSQHDHTLQGSTAYAGGTGGVTQTHENMQPWIALTPLIKT